MKELLTQRIIHIEFLINKFFSLKSQALQEVSKDLILDKPIMAFEELDSNIVILDRKRAIRINRNNDILWEFICKNE
ncbi:MAG: hypothetical protein KatS3mg068_1293 [Candidatus Sericytochromatia bacterium]|nr:MAG: hypothetical protein KatS3mg068_1293 [Candidatus Sericytochromatia bacterium]